MNKIVNADKTVYHISANWNPCEPIYEILNTTTSRGKLFFLSLSLCNV